jgi:DNA-binding response OmpR family regulator
MPVPDTPDLHGLRILVVEDSLLIADVIVDALCDCGCRTIGPAPRLEQGLMLAAVERLDGALLDVNLAGENCFPIAAALDARRVPFAFLTGYGELAIPAEYRAVPRLTKPFTIDALMRLVAHCFATDADRLHSERD